MPFWKRFTANEKLQLPSPSTTVEELRLQLQAAQRELEMVQQRTQKRTKLELLDLEIKHVQSLLPIREDFLRAWKALSQEEKATPWAQGIGLCIKKIGQELTNRGVVQFGKYDQGRPFDPHRHQAVEVLYDPDPRQDQILVRVIQRGYYLRRDDQDILLQPALVSVSVNHPVTIR